MINGVLWRTRTGAPWRDVPSSYGNWKGIHSRHRRWSGDGTWELILDRLRTGCDGDVGSEWTVGVDSSVVRAHQHAAGARHQPPKDIPAERAGADAVLRPATAPATGSFVAARGPHRGLGRMTRIQHRRHGLIGRVWAVPAAG